MLRNSSEKFQADLKFGWSTGIKNVQSECVRHSKALHWSRGKRVGRGGEEVCKVAIEFSSTSEDQIKHKIPIWINDILCVIWKIDPVCSIWICFSRFFTGTHPSTK